MKDIWKKPTRRAFVAMLGLGAAALATVKIEKPEKQPLEPAKPFWIGHC